MSVILIKGGTGAGKGIYMLQELIVPQLHLEQQKLEVLEQGVTKEDSKYIGPPRRIFCNIDGLNHEEIANRCNLKLSLVKDRLIYVDPLETETIQNFWKLMSYNDIFIMDEGQLYFGSGVFNRDLSNRLRDYMSMHRHQGHDIYVATQSLDFLDINFRRLCHFTHSLKKYALDRSGTTVSGAIFEKDYVTLEPAGRFKFKHKKDTYYFYKSFDSEQVQEVQVKAPIYGLKKVVIIASIVLLLFAYSISGVMKNGIYGAGKSKSKVPPTKKTIKPGQIKKPIRPGVSEKGNVTQSATRTGYVKRVVFADSALFIFEDGSRVVAPKDAFKGEAW